MFPNKLQLVCTFFAFCLFHSVQCQASSTATENGIVSAAGSPQTTQSISYTIEGADNTSTFTSSPAVMTGEDASPIDNTDTSVASNSQERLSMPAIIGTTSAIILAVVGIILFSIYIHKRRCEAIARAKRKTILDAEFAPSMEKVIPAEPDKQPHQHSNSEGTIGYFDIAKPLPTIKPESVEDDRLSRSSTIIAASDAAEVAQINRKASAHQGKVRNKQQRSATHDRHQALQSLTANARGTGPEQSMVRPVRSSNKPIEQRVDVHRPGECTDGDGDAFTRRPAKI